MYFTRHTTFGVLACLGLLLLASGVDASGGGATVLYDVDFSSPLHTVGAPPTTGLAAAPRATATQVRRQPALIASSYGDLGDQPLVFPGPRRGDVEFSLAGLVPCPDYRLEMSVVVDTELRLLLSTPLANVIHFRPNGQVVASIRDLATNSQTNTVVATFVPGDGAAHRFVLQVDFLSDSLEISFDGVVYAADFGQQASLTSFRLLGTRAAVDDILLASGIEAAVIDATVEVRPGSEGPAPINLKSRGVLPVALLSTDELDASDVDPASLVLSDADRDGANGVAPLRTSFEDVDGDGVLDLVMHVLVQALVDAGQLGASTTAMALEGMTMGGEALRGVDDVRIVGRARR